MNPLKSIILGILLISFFSGCAHTARVTAITEEPSVPTESLGTLEVNLRTNPWLPENLWYQFLEVIFLGFPDTSYATRLKNKLVNESDKYKADQIVSVVYWPDLYAGNFPEGRVRARGKMVRYQHFPTKT